MTTLRMCKSCSKWHDLDEPWPCPLPVRNQAFYVISDTMESTRHMGTGQILDSKAKFRQATRAAGCVEIGNEPIKPRKPIKLDGGQRREAIRKAIYDLRNGN